MGDADLDAVDGAHDGRLLGLVGAVGHGRVDRGEVQRAVCATQPQTSCQEVQKLKRQTTTTADNKQRRENARLDLQILTAAKGNRQSRDERRVVSHSHATSRGSTPSPGTPATQTPAGHRQR